jgi:4-aminobutyrate aminotransferase / (S)-3-amino-2-methylpropionate transaminase / 5-aminovalerate transaminase
MIAFDVLTERGSDEPDPAMAKLITKRAYENGLVLLSCGVNFNTIRVLVPLTCPYDVLDEGLAILEKCLALPT